MWRGKPTTGQSGDLVVFLNHTACSDNMSDKTHPVSVRVSLADHRALAGCCRIVADAWPQRRACYHRLHRRTDLGRLTALRGFDAKALHAAEGPVMARFQEGRVSGFSGCNRFFGGYTIDGDRIVIGQLAGSMMMCAEPVDGVGTCVYRRARRNIPLRVAGKLLTLASGPNRC